MVTHAVLARRYERVARRAPLNLYLVLAAGPDDRHSVELGPIGFARASVRDLVDRLEDSLCDWIVESGSGWGEVRTVPGDLLIPASAVRADGTPTVVLDVDDECAVVICVDEVPGTAQSLGVSPGLADDLAGWLDALDRDLTELGRIADGQQNARRWRRFGHPQPGGGFTVYQRAPEQVAADERAAAQALANVHLGPWRQLVDVYEPARDALLQRLRDELGSSFHVPVLARIP